MAGTTAGRSVFYGWWIVVAGFVAMLCLGEVMWSFGVFFNALEAEFGWSRSQTSSGFTMMVLGYGVSAIVAGRITDRHTARPVLLGSSLLGGTSIALCSTIHSVAQLQLLLFLTGLGAGALLSAPSSTVQRWFHRRSRGGIALAIVMAGVGAGGLVFAPVINHLIAVVGWRQTFIIAGGVFLVAVSAAGIVIRPVPLSPTEGAVYAGTDGIVSPSGELMRSPKFMLITGIMGVSVFGYQAVNVHLMPMVTDSGIAAATAAAALGLSGGFSVFGRMMSGMLSERLKWEHTFALSQVGVGAALLLLAITSHVWLLYCVVGLYGVSQGARAVSVTGTMGRVFGMRAIGELTGIVMAIAQLVGAAGPYAAGFLHDSLGSYTLMLVVLGIAYLLCAALIFGFLAGPRVRRAPPF